MTPSRDAPPGCALRSPARLPLSPAALTLSLPPPPPRRWLPAAASRAGGGCCCCNFRFSRAPTSSSRLQVGAGRAPLRPAGRGRAGGCGSGASPGACGAPSRSDDRAYCWTCSLASFFQLLKKKKKCTISSFKMATGELLLQF